MTNPGRYRGPELRPNRTPSPKAPELCSERLQGQVRGILLKGLGKRSPLLPLCTSHAPTPATSTPHSPATSIPHSPALGLEETPKTPSTPVVKASRAPSPGGCPTRPQAGSPHAQRPAHAAILSSAGPAAARSHSRLAAGEEVGKQTH